MNQLGMGVMLKMLCGNEKTVEAVKRAIGNTIEDAVVTEKSLSLVFHDGVLRLWDDGQSCCEERYMRTDDIPTSFIGAKVVNIEIKPAPDIEEKDGEPHEVQFLEVMTDRGALTMASHNIHNGYYGGFSIAASWEDK